MEFGLIPPEHWSQPDSIDENKATASRNKMVKQNIIYGGSVSYRNMCRFNSGVRINQYHRQGSADAILFFRQFFFKHPLVLKYRWYWRIECVTQFPTHLHPVNLWFSDPTSSSTVTSYMTPFYIWKNTRRSIVSSQFSRQGFSKPILMIISYQLLLLRCTNTKPQFHLYGGMSWVRLVLLGDQYTWFFFSQFRFRPWSPGIYRKRQFTRIPNGWWEKLQPVPLLVSSYPLCTGSDT